MKRLAPAIAILIGLATPSQADFVAGQAALGVMYDNGEGVPPVGQGAGPAVPLAGQAGHGKKDSIEAPQAKLEKARKELR